MNWDDDIRNVVNRWNGNPIRNDGTLEAMIKGLIQEICDEADMTRQKLKRANKANEAAACMITFLTNAKNVSTSPPNRGLESHVTITSTVDDQTRVKLTRWLKELSSLKLGP